MFNRDNFQKMLIIAITTTLMGQVYINPFNSPFRLSLGIAILVFLILKFTDVSIMLTNICTALFVFILRITIDFFQFYGSYNFGTYNLIIKHLPSAIYYIVFGLCLYQLKIRSFRDKPIYFVFLVGISDIVSNIAEALVRHEFTSTSIEIILRSFFMAGFIRAIIALALYYSVKKYNMLILKEEHQNRYENLILLTANMRAEAFFLKKTMQDIELAMEKSYTIYNELKENKNNEYLDKLKEQILNLSKDIHEIKKDNQRVLSGIEGLFPEDEKGNTMEIDNLFKLLIANTKRYIESLGKDIKIHFEYNNSLIIKDYYPLITILDNLINNSIDAITYSGCIRIAQDIMDNYVVFEVMDNGKGIKKQDIDVIFEPGYSTKFDKTTGKMSTGIGLTHVKHILTRHYKGKIEVESEKDKGTKFTIYIPKEAL